jgi:hypothetical protein
MPSFGTDDWGSRLHEEFGDAVLDVASAETDTVAAGVARSYVFALFAPFGSDPVVDPAYGGIVETLLSSGESGSVTPRSVSALVLDFAVTVELERRRLALGDHHRDDANPMEGIRAFMIKLFLEGLLTLRDAELQGKYIFSAMKSDVRASLAEQETLFTWPIADAWDELTDRVARSGCLSHEEIAHLQPFAL